MAAMEIVPQGLFKAFIDLVPGAFSEYLLGGIEELQGRIVWILPASWRSPTSFVRALST